MERADMSPLPVASFVVIGSEQLAREFERLDQKVQKQAAREALSVGAGQIASAMKASTQFKDVTGILRRGIKPRPGKGDRTGTVSVLIRSDVTARQYIAAHKAMGRKPGAIAVAEKNFAGKASQKYRVFYSRLVDFGHRGPFGGGKPTPPHPFARMAFDSVAEEAADVIVDTLGSKIEEM
jgi:HK97 gp10 family phage protein